VPLKHLKVAGTEVIQMSKDSSAPKSVLCPPVRRETKSLLTCFKNQLPTSKNFITPWPTRNYITVDDQPHTSRREKHSQHTLHFKYSDGQTGFPHAANGQLQEGGRKTN